MCRWKRFVQQRMRGASGWRPRVRQPLGVLTESLATPLTLVGFNDQFDP
jgi:hypothetical protein